MAKLALIALTFAAIVAFLEVSAYTTITTTKIKDGVFSNTRGSQSYQQCHRQIPMQEVYHCEMYLTKGTSQMMPHLQLCCNQLMNIEQECQCEAIQQVFQQTQQQDKQGAPKGRQQMLRMAEHLPNDCRLQVQQCPIQSPRV